MTASGSRRGVGEIVGRAIAAPVAAPAFTVERTADLVRTVLKRGRLRHPSAPALAEMARELSFIAAQAGSAPVPPDDTTSTLYEREPMRRAQMLRADVARLMEARRRMGDNLPGDMPDVAAANRADVAAMERLCAALDAAMPALAAAPTPKPWRGDQWHTYAGALACIFRIAISSTNDIDRAPLGLSDNGPVVRFVRLAITALPGPEIECPAIAQHLKRLASAPGWT